MSGDANVPQLSALDRARVLSVMRRWVAAHPQPAEPNWLSAQGELISPRRLLEGMEGGDAVGRFWLRRLALAKTGAAPVSLDALLDAHEAQAADWESRPSELG